MQWTQWNHQRLQGANIPADQRMSGPEMFGDWPQGVMPNIPADQRMSGPERFTGYMPPDQRMSGPEMFRPSTLPPPGMSGITTPLPNLGAINRTEIFPPGRFPIQGTGVNDITPGVYSQPPPQRMSGPEMFNTPTGDLTRRNILRAAGIPGPEFNPGPFVNVPSADQEEGLYRPPPLLPSQRMSGPEMFGNASIGDITRNKILNRAGIAYPESNPGPLLGLPSAGQEEGLYRPPPIPAFTGDMNLGGGDPMWPGAYQPIGTGNTVDDIMYNRVGFVPHVDNIAGLPNYNITGRGR
jgi:hypothetical protein